MSPVRQVGSRTCHLTDLDLDPADSEVEQPTAVPEDPARVAAGLLIERVLAEVGATVEDAGCDGAVCAVLVPSVVWIDVVRDEWQSYARRGDRYSDGVQGRVWREHRWVAWAPVEAPRPTQRCEGASTLADAIWRGLHCLGVAADLDWLPADLVQAADYRLVLPVLTGADLGLLARDLCGDEPSVPLSDEETAALTPRLLRLVRRPGQTADAYSVKVRDLLKRDRAAAAASTPVFVDSPRDRPALDRLHGMDEAVAWGQALARDLAAYRAGTLSWSDVDRGCLLSGPPGCGKALFARALATACDVPLINGSYGQWLGAGHGGQGDLLKGMRRAFADAKSKAPAVLFIDEVDSFPNRATVTHRWAD